MSCAVPCEICDRLKAERNAREIAKLLSNAASLPLPPEIDHQRALSPTARPTFEQKLEIMSEDNPAQSDNF